MAVKRRADVLLLAVGALYLGAVLHTAWVGDDAFITLRALDNLLHGYGLLSNPPERVLGFTHPLWALVLLVPLALGASAYASALTAGLVFSIACAKFLLLDVTPNRWVAIAAGSLLTLSSAYVDFSTSGLENPLAHLLLAVFFAGFMAGRLAPGRARTWLLAALIALDRHDHALLVAPALIAICVQKAPTGIALTAPWRSIARAASIGALPLLCWFAFALVYYGFPLPNTVYAKLNVQLPPGALLAQGARYFDNSWQRDPITLLVIVAALTQVARDRSRTAIAAAAGLILYLAYVVWIGGDFMRGRFFTAPFLVALVWLMARALDRLRARTLAALSLCSCAALFLFPVSFQATVETCGQDHGIVNERLCYPDLALIHNLHGTAYVQHTRWRRGEKLRAQGPRVVVYGAIGMLGYTAGPTVHVIDRNGLTDPLLARIPFRAEGAFRIGHLQRETPPGYELTLRSGSNRIEDPCLHAYYAVLDRVIRGPLFSLARWRAIVALNAGHYDELVRERCRTGERTRWESAARRAGLRRGR